MQTSVSNLLKQKKEAKGRLARELGFKAGKPLLGIFLDKELDSGMEEKIKTILEGASAINVEVVILADSNVAALSPFARVLEYGRANRSRLLEACDIALTFDFSDVEEMLLNGVIPVSGRRGEVKDYDCARETGNAFVYGRENVWSIFAAIVRAVETFKFPYDWKHIVREGVGSVVKD